MKSPDLQSSFIYRDNEYKVDWFDVTDKTSIPDLKWQQVYVIGLYEGLVPVVQYPEDKNNLPGGKLEPGESLAETIVREMEEETNMRVTSWQPLGYQQVTSPTGEVDYQFRVCAQLEKIGEFVNDPGGNIIGNIFVPLDDLNGVIDYGDVGVRMVDLAKRHFH